MVILDELLRQAMLGKSDLIEGLHKKPSVVLEHIRRQHHHTGEICFLFFQYLGSSWESLARERRPKTELSDHACVMELSHQRRILSCLPTIRYAESA